MGFSAGQMILCLGRSPLRCSLILQLGDCVYSIEQSIAKRINIEEADENKTGLAANMRHDSLVLGAGIGPMVFYVVASQCVANMATIKGETASVKIVWRLFVTVYWLNVLHAWPPVSFNLL